MTAQQEQLALAGVFESRENPRTPAVPLSYISTLKRWRGVAQPRHMSEVPRGFAPVDVTVGAMLLGFDTLPKRATKRKPAPAGEQLPEHELLPQMVAIASVLEATRDDGAMLYDEVVIESERRTAKTTSIWCTLVGRCMRVPGHKVAFTAQSGVKASEIFLDMATQLEAQWNATHEPYELAPFRVYRGVGHELVKFDNGSIIRAYPPDPASLRSAAADTVYIEEAQEHNAAKSATLLGGILPLMDTMDAPQVIVAGTPGEATEGLLFDSLEQGRAGKIGIVSYGVPVDDNGIPLKDCTDPRTWDAHHPGIGTLTTLEIITKRYDKLDYAQFLREYCCVWPIDTGSRVIGVDMWESCRVPWGERVQQLPARFAVGYDVDPDQNSAAVAIAWRDDDELAHVEIIASRDGDEWLAKFLSGCAVNSRNVAFGYDSIGSNLAIADQLARAARGRPRLVPMQGKATAAATSAIYTLIKTGKLRHYDQPALNGAVERAGRRGTQSESGWYWSRKGRVAPLVASTIALATLDRQPAGTRPSFGSGRTTERQTAGRAPVERRQGSRKPTGRRAVSR